MTESSSPAENLAEARQVAEAIAESLPKKVDAATLTLRSKVPFKAFSLRELLSHRVSALASPAVDLFEQDCHLAAVVLTRAVLETVAIIYALHKELRSFLDTKDTHALDDFLTNCLTANRWEGATDQAYQAKKRFIDHADKQISGFRLMSDDLSEYGHPNWCGLSGMFGSIEQVNYVLNLGMDERAAIFASGVNALCYSLLAMEHYYNDMAEMLYQLNEHFDARSGNEA